MQVQYNELENGIRFVRLIGTLDIVGVGEIETKFTGYCAGEGPLVLVDFTGVDFLASIGIRLLTLNAKSIASRGGRMVLLNPLPEVMNVLDVTGIPAFIPIYDTLESAEAILLGDNRPFVLFQINRAINLVWKIRCLTTETRTH